MEEPTVAGAAARLAGALEGGGWSDVVRHAAALEHALGALAT